jgi:RNA polymerase sigma-70 factor, ECF subfamily
MRYLTPVLGAPADWRMTPTNANGQPAALAYRRSESGAYEPFAIVLLTTTTTGISRITLFGNTHLFARFALPQISASASRS